MWFGQPWHGSRLSFRKVAYVVLGLYLLITCYTTFHLLQRSVRTQVRDQKILERIKTLTEISDDPEWNPWGEEFQLEQQTVTRHPAPALWQVEVPRSQPEQPNASAGLHVVEVWGKAAIGLYLWEHILEGVLEPRLNGIWSFGEKTVGSIIFRFRTGPGVVPSQVPQDTQHLLLVLNGREPSKVEVSKMWLEHLPSMAALVNVAVLLLGSEQCNNSWILPYLSPHGGLVKAVFLVYDSPEVDNMHVFQWPLGVATYRGFPAVIPSILPLSLKRPYKFNFLGTVYQNSSRETLLSTLKQSNLSKLGYIKARPEWLPAETDESRDEYLHALSSSDLTLSPAGINTECYRIYESLAVGAVPVIEDVMTPTSCGDVSQHTRGGLVQLFPHQSQAQLGSRTGLRNWTAPLRLLKEWKAPVFYVRDWKRDLDQLLRQESRLSHLDIVRRRESVIKWYQLFKASMREQLIAVLLDKFFNITNR